MRTEPCKQCGSHDWYYRGQFSYCRPCHSEAQKRYVERKRQASEVELLKPPNKPLHAHSFNSVNVKLACSQGHSLTGDNVRISSQRNGKHLRRLCRTCERNAKRVKYGLAPEPAPIRLSELLDTYE